MLPPCFAIYGTLHLQRPAKRGENKIVAQRPALKQRGENKIVVSADALETEGKADCPKKQNTKFVHNFRIRKSKEVNAEFEFSSCRTPPAAPSRGPWSLKQHLPGDHKAVDPGLVARTRREGKISSIITLLGMPSWWRGTEKTGSSHQKTGS